MIISVDVDLSYLAEVVVLSSFLQCKLFSPFSILYLKDIIMCRKPLRNGNLYSTYLMGEYLHNLFVILQHGRYVYSSSFIYLLRNIGSHIFILYFGLKSKTFLFCCFNWLWPLGAISVDTYVSVTCPYHSIWIPFSFSVSLSFYFCTVLLSLTTIYSRLVKYIPCLVPKLHIFPKPSGSFNWEMTLETKTYVLGSLVFSCQENWEPLAHSSPIFHPPPITD